MYSQYVQGQIFCRLNNAQLTGEVDNVHKFNLRFVNQGTPIALRVLAFSVRIDRFDQLTAAGSPIQDTVKAALVYRTDQTNDYGNATFAATYARLNDVWNRLNTTCQKTMFSAVGCEGLDDLIGSLCTGEGANCTFNVNNTEVLEALEMADTEIGMGIADFVMVLVLGLLVLWAERTKDLLIYALAALGCAMAALILENLSWARLLFVGAAVLLVARAIVVYNMETDQE